MPSLTERFRDLFPGPRQRRQMNEALVQLSAVFERRNLWAGPNLKELDSRSLEMIIRHANDIKLSGDAVYGTVLTESDRQQAVADCRAAYYWDVIVRRIIGMWTDYSFGLNIGIVPQDAAAVKPWDEFWTANRNRSVLSVRNQYKLSDRLLTDGELFLLFFIARKGGLATIRTIPPEEVGDFVCASSDQDVTYFYHRQWSDTAGIHDVYYRDWTVKAGDGEGDLPQGVQLAHELDADTDVQVMHLAMNTLGQRGVPLMMPGIEWTRQYRDFLWDRAAVARAIATFVDEYKVKGGSRAVDAVRAALTSALTVSGQYYETNPPPVAGSSNVHNEAVDYKRQPLATGAGDAAQDASMFIAQAGLAGGIPPHLLGRGEAFRLATATAMGDPLRRQWTRQQGFWKDAWGDVVDLVLTAQEVYGKQSFASHECDVSIDPIPDQTFLELSQALTPAVAGGFFDANVAKKMMMEAAGEKQEEGATEQPAPTEEETPQEETPVTESEVWATLGRDVADAAKLLKEVASQGPFEFEEGGAGSGNWGHTGIPGKHGGSKPTGGIVASGKMDGASMSPTRTGQTAAARANAARVAAGKEPKPEVDTGKVEVADSPKAPERTPEQQEQDAIAKEYPEMREVFDAYNAMTPGQRAIADITGAVALDSAAEGFLKQIEVDPERVAVATEIENEAARLGDKYDAVMMDARKKALADFGVDTEGVSAGKAEWQGQMIEKTGMAMEELHASYPMKAGDVTLLSKASGLKSSYIKEMAGRIDKAQSVGEAEELMADLSSRLGTARNSSLPYAKNLWTAQYQMQRMHEFDVNPRDMAVSEFISKAKDVQLGEGKAAQKFIEDNEGELRSLATKSNSFWGKGAPEEYTGSFILNELDNRRSFMDKFGAATYADLPVGMQRSRGKAATYTMSKLQSSGSDSIRTQAKQEAFYGLGKAKPENIYGVKSLAPDVAQREMDAIVAQHKSKDASVYKQWQPELRGAYDILPSKVVRDGYKALNDSQDNSGEFYHGTGFGPMASINRHGYRPALGDRSTGSMLGDGVYLAKLSSKSGIYTGKNAYDIKGSRGALMVNRVAIGKDKEHHVYAPKGTDFGSGPLWNDEWCVRDARAAMPVRVFDYERVSARRRK